MTANQSDWQALERCCNGNREAMEWLCLWRQYVHAIDDIIDGKPELGSAGARAPEFILATFAQAIFLYSHPFYLKNIAALRQLVVNCTSAYADTVAWENSSEEWQREFADHYRHFGAELVLAVAGLCAAPGQAYATMRAIAPELRTVCYLEHHTKEGKPC